MASSGLRGPFPLTQQSINEHIVLSAAGAYALGKMDGKTFMISRVGRSDVDVGDRLADYIGEYHEFKFELYATAKAAFEKECCLYHDFDPPGNLIHPDRPAKTDWRCPVCNLFD